VNPEGWKRAKKLFSAALALPEAEREAFLAAQQDERETLDEVRSLLTAYRDSPDFLENAAPNLPADPQARDTATPFAGRRVGAWELVREIGQGGMGVVWEARRADQQYEQRAAVKLLRASLFSEQDARRFREERQILASLNHPSIARLLDGGMLEDGEPYLVMEFIDGLPLDGWCELHRSNLRQRIEICLEICSAVEFAHRQLVIHRDLKPANILVGAGGTPKLLDFGIAKLVAEGGSYRTTTNLLTPECASPEQARGERMSTASDQFSLGVLLYQLLTGRHPFAKPDASPIEALRAICEDEPRLPSSVAENWSRELRGELDAILLQTLNKNPAARYSSVSAFAGDLRAWLDGLPVSAVRQSWWRRSRKVILRYKALSAAIATAVLMLVTGIVVTSIEARRALRAEREALSQRDRAESAQQAAQTERDRAVAAEKAAVGAEKAATAERNRAINESQRADTEAKNAHTINDFLEKDILAQADPNTEPDPDLKVRTALDQAAAHIEGKFEDQPLVEASLQHSLGVSYHGLGLYSEAQRHTERALALRRKYLGLYAPETLTTTTLLGTVLLDASQFDKAEPILRSAYETSRKVLGENAPETLSTEQQLASVWMQLGRTTDAEPLLKHNLAMRRRELPRNDAALNEAIAQLAALYEASERLAEAETLARESVELALKIHGPEHPVTLFSQYVLASTLQSENKLEQAERIYLEVLETRKRVLGLDHPDTLDTMYNLACLYQLMGRYEEAIRLLNTHLAATKLKFGEENPRILNPFYSLGYAYIQIGKFAEAEPFLNKVLETDRRLNGENHQGSLALLAIQRLGILYRYQGRYAAAEPLARGAAAELQKMFGLDHSYAVSALTSWGVLLQDEGKDMEAETTLSKALELNRKNLTPGYSTTRSCLFALSRLRLKQGRDADAEKLLREAIEITNEHGYPIWDRFDGQSLLGAALLGQGKYAEAEPLLISGYEGLQELSPAISVEANLPEAGERIVRLYTAWGQPEKAAEWRQRLQDPEK
jgi:tetratricopeptide (TPR) repeat protein/predicted Ser/Thr protein kinase